MAGGGLTAWSGWAGVVVACFAFCIAVWSARTARANLMIAQGNAVSRLLEAYASPDMEDALEALALSKTAITKHLAGEYADASNFENGVRISLKARFDGGEDASAEPMMKVLRRSGRRIHWFVKQADILRRNGALSDKLFRQAVAETNGYRLWATVWLPYLKVTPTGGQREAHLDWADALVDEFPPEGGTD